MYSLFLYDSNHHKKLYSEQQLSQYLNTIQFATYMQKQLVPAHLFMRFITFLGCSPNLDTGVSTLISIKLNNTTSAYGGDSIAKIICPMCKDKVKNPSDLIANFNTKPIWDSSCCQQKIHLDTINWRKSAGFSQSFIQVSNIFPKEAIPSDELLAQLSKFSHSTWNYFYSKQQIF